MDSVENEDFHPSSSFAEFVHSRFATCRSAPDGDCDIWQLPVCYVLSLFSVSPTRRETTGEGGGHQQQLVTNTEQK